jgi:microcystin-dependent protein
MATPFLGEIRLLSFNFAPRGWALCNGQLLPINQNQALFSLMSTTYGGDGRVTFGLPDLRGRVPVHRGTYPQGARFGVETVTLNTTQVPLHAHQPLSTTAGAGATLAAGALPATAVKDVYLPALELAGVNMASTTSAGGSQAHDNRMPSLVLSFCVALQGIFPSQN